MKRHLLLGTFLFLLILKPLFVRAQFEMATVLGYVHDSSGAVVQNASVTLRNQGKQNQVTVRTDAQGAFEFTDVTLGQYAITAQAPGFSTTTTAPVPIPTTATTIAITTPCAGNTC